MPRPREVGPGEIVSTKLSLRDAQLLKLLAQQKGIGVSKLVRQILLSYIYTHYPQGQQEDTSLDNHNIIEAKDPLDVLEEEEFKEALNKLEKTVDTAIKSLQVMKNQGYGYRTYSSYELPNAWDLLQKWNKLKRWYRKMPRNREFSEALVQLHRKIKEYGKLKGDMV